MKIFKFICAALLLSCGQAQAVIPAAFNTLCASVVPPVGSTVTPEEVIVMGVERYYCVFTPASYLIANTKHRVVYVFHGGNQNAAALMQASKGIMAEAEARDYVVVFAQGSDKLNCGIGYAANANWSDTDCATVTNVHFTRSMMNKVAKDYAVEENFVQLAGFSGGSKHIYRLISQWGPSVPKIRSIATMAGSIGRLSFERHRDGFAFINILEGKPVNAMLLQGGSDNRMPLDGGISDRGHEVSFGFDFKVDMFRALNAARTPAGGLNVSALGALPVVLGVPVALPLLPAGVVAEQFLDARTVIALTKPSLTHQWAGWYSPVAFNFFDSF